MIRFEDSIREGIEARDKEHLSWLVEGIDIDKDNRIVSYNPNHDDNVYSLKIYRSKLGCYNIISLFSPLEK